MTVRLFLVVIRSLVDGIPDVSIRVPAINREQASFFVESLCDNELSEIVDVTEIH